MRAKRPCAPALRRSTGVGTWENTTYVQCADVEGVIDAVVGLFSEEGMQRIPRPAPRKPGRFDPMQYAGSLENNLWGVALSPGAPGWTIIKTAPLEIFGERAPGAHRMRLVDLAARLGAAACQVNLYDTSSLVLAELDREGRCLLSGYCLRSDGRDPLRFNDEEIGVDRLDPRIELLLLQPLIEGCTRDQDGVVSLDNDGFVLRLAETLGGDNVAACSNLISVEYLLGHLPLTIGSGIDLYFEWPARDRRSVRLDQLMASRPDLLG
jgi:hypothetical protein